MKFFKPTLSLGIALLTLAFIPLTLVSCSRRASHAQVNTGRGSPSTQTRRDQNMDIGGTVNAPEFPTGLQWLNTNKPVTLKQLRGKVVLLDFWTYC